MSEFNPKPYLIDIRGKQYLEVKWRLVWLRHEHPDWAITTQLLATSDPVIVRATVADADGRTIATGHAEYPRGRQFPGIMKAETSAIGRALAHAGFGTQFSGEDVAEPDLVDAPVGRPNGGHPAVGQTRGARPPVVVVNRAPANANGRAATQR